MSGLASLLGDFQISETSVTLPIGASTPIVSADPTRWAISFGVPPGGPPIAVSINTAIGAGLGNAVSAAFPNFTLNFRDHGAWVNLPWFGLATAGGSVVTVTTVLYRPTGPTLDLEDIVSELKKLERNSPWRRDQLMALRQALRLPE
jgi:hypothetical protein